MKDKYEILLVCAMGYATSTMLKMHINNLLKENNIEAELQSVSINNLQNYLSNADLIITSLPLDENEYEIPVINAMELITGRNKEEVFDKILSTIKLLD